MNEVLWAIGISVIAGSVLTAVFYGVSLLFEIKKVKP